MKRIISLAAPVRRLALCASAAGVAVLLSACADTRGIDTQATLRSPQALGLATEPSAADQAAVVAAVDAQWWKGLGDERLNQMVDTALADSPNLKVAEARIRKAWAVAQMAQAADKPQVNAEANASRNHAPANGMVPPPMAGNNYSTATAQLGGSWSLDLFGKHRAALDAAVGTARATQADHDAARVLLASSVVQAYVQLARWQEQEKVAERAIAQRENTLKLVRDRYNAGLDTNLEVRQSESGVPEARVQLTQVLEQKQLTQNALAALLGQPVQAAQLQAAPMAALRIPQLPQQLSASLLGRRADVVAARWRVEAADHLIAEAKAEFYPDINLTAFVGLSSIGLGNFLQGNARQWGVGPALSLPIFDAGRLRANLAGKSADYDVAVEGYNQAVINAVHDVADQITSAKSAYAQMPEQQKAAEAAQSALDIANQRYAAGLGTFLNVLSAETNVLAQRRLTVDIQARILSSNAALAQSLGGGYSAASDVPAATAPDRGTLSQS
ncbi:MAG: efflux transporter outer membrane subunit [Comamonas sp.]